ncbi:hypothetical protein PMAYCL1PPCAC_03332 [Pristionchus mayeri]|uniref:Uncharacterized protein n=1 Tax=Pristionchus mayeri TaxID=1317129 RepID=A0AAN5C7V6_9BILA|nr:hypothetical protein PMAYCL1PPCAC_03332 [Pristionchus mayeri]
MRMLLLLPLLIALFGYSLARNFPYSVDKVKRQVTQQSSSTNCVTTNGRQTCTVCTNGNCQTTDGNGEDSGHATSTSHKFPAASNGQGDVSRQSTSTSRSCSNNNGQVTCTECNNGVCHTTSNGQQQALGSVTSTGPRESLRSSAPNDNRKVSEQSTSSSRSCTTTNGVRTCTVCVNGSCHTE